MRIIKELDVFIDHDDWYTKDKNRFFVPTEKAPPEAVKAMEHCNELARRDEERHVHTI